MTVAAVPDESAGGGPRELDARGIAAVELVLRARVDRHASTLVDVSDELAELAAALCDAATGGKRLRAAFCLWGARGAAGGADVAGATEAAAALELFHLAALVHDDLMDHSDARRGRPTVHRRFTDQHAAAGRVGDGDEYGAAVAVLAGDLCLTWSDDLLAEAVAASGPETGPQARAVWTLMRDQVLAGQFLDVLGQARGSATTAQVSRVLQYKSAKYTVEHPLLLGGALAGAGPELLAGYRAFGLRVGEAFQLRDDVLGVFGTPTVTGKPVLDDLREGKRTLLVTYAEDRGTLAQQQVLDAQLGNPDLDHSGAVRVREVLVATGALSRVEERIGQLVAEALEELDRMPVDERTRDALDALTGACAWRSA